MLFEAFEPRWVLSVPPVSFAAPQAISFAPSASVVAATGDLNRDGIVDLVAANANSTVSALLGNGDGTFRTGSSWPTGGNASHATLADFNKDGKLDLTTSNPGSNNMSVLLGLGDGTFGPTTNLAAGAYAFGVAAGDFNKDDKIDLVTSNLNGGGVTVFRGNGDGTFQPATFFSTGGGPGNVETADFDNNGVLDLVTAMSATNQVSVLFGNANGTLQAPILFSAGAYTYDVVAADLNRDGNTDIVAINYDGGTMSVFINQGNKSFASLVPTSIGVNPNSIKAGDFNNDGNIDVAISCTNSGNGFMAVLAGNGDGTFAASFSLPLSGLNQVAAADFDGNGTTDLVGSKTASDLAFWRNTGTPANPHLSIVVPSNEPPGLPGAVTVAALDGNNNVLTGFTGTAHFASSDTQATLPTDYTFQAADQGVKRFNVTLRSLGAQTISATLVGSSGIFAGALANTLQPAAWYRAEGNANDSVGSNNGALQSGATLATGKLGQAFSFNGSSAVNIFKTNSVFDPGASNFTVEGWIKYAQASDPDGGALYYNYGGVPRTALFTDGNQHLGFKVRDNSGNEAAVIGSALLGDNLWHHVAAVRQGATFTIYVDGQLDGQSVNLGVGSVNPGNQYVRIGGANSGPGNLTSSTANEFFYVGLIDELGHYQRVLTPLEIQSLAASTNTSPVPNAGGPYIANPGSTVTLTGSASSDGEEPAANLVYAWDLNNDGTYGDATGINYVFDPAALGPQTLTVGLKVTDAQGLFSTTSTTITISAFNGSDQPQSATGDIALNSDLTFGDQAHPSVAVINSAGDFVAVWEDYKVDGSFLAIVKRRFSANGTPLEPTQLVNQATFGDQVRPDIASDGNGHYVITWMSFPSGAPIYTGYRIYDGGNPVTGERVVPSQGQHQQAPRVAMLPADGSFVITWANAGNGDVDASVWAQRFNADGSPKTSAVPVANANTLNQWYSDVALDENGNAVITWASDGQDGSGNGIYARRYDANLIPIGNEFRVNTTTAGDQHTPKIAVAEDGGFVITWQSSGQDGSGLGVYAQRYDASGYRLSGEFRVNSFTAGDQGGPAVAVNPNDGNFLIYWHSNGQDGSGYGTYAQYYDASGIARGNPVLVNSYTISDQIVGYSSPVTFSPATNQAVFGWFGYAAHDGSGWGVAGRVFNVSPGPSNQQPTDIALSNTSLLENLPAGTAVGNLSTSDPDAGNTFTYSLVTGSGSTDNASFTIVGNELRSAAVFNYEAKSSYRVLVRSTDNGGLFFEKAFAIAVSDVNEVPMLSPIANPAPISEDSGQQTVNLTGITAGGPGESQSLTVTATSSDPSLIPNPTVTYSSPASTGALSFTPAANAAGTATITVTVKDSGGTAFGGVDTVSRTFIVAVTPVNDEPSFTAAALRPVDKNAGTITLPGWAIFNPGGGADETTQAPTYIVTNVSNPGLFAVQPVVAANGTLTYTLVGNTIGTSTFDLSVQDSGGTADGGDNTSLVSSYTIRADQTRLANIATSADTFITDADGLFGPASTHGQDQSLWSINYFTPGGGGSLATRPMFQFDLSEYAGVTLTTGVTFRAYLIGPSQNPDYFHGDSRRVDLYQLTSTWDAATVSWNTRPSATYLSSQWVLHDSESSNNRYITWTVPQAVVQGWIDHPATNFGLMLVNELPDAFFYDLVFAWRERTYPQDKPALLDIQGIDLPNHRPTNIGLSPTTLPEGQPAGTVVGTLTASDPDVGDTFTYTLVTGESSDDNARFTIDHDTLRSSVVFDYEAKSSYSIRVQASDDRGLTFEKVLNIGVDNLAPVEPNDADPAANEAPEGSATGVNVGITAFSTDPAGGTVTYSLTSSAGGRFTINASTGVVTVANGSLLDGPGPQQITVAARDGQLTTTATFSIAVTNVAPTATLSAPSQVTYGQDVALALTNPFDPSSADTAAGFHYAFGYGTANASPLTAATYANSSPTAWTTISSLNANSYYVFARIIDKDEGFAEYSQQVTVAQATPTVSYSGYTGGTYDGNAHTQTVTVTGVAANLLYTTSLSGTNAELYSQAWSYSSNPNYTGVSGTLAFDIAQASSTVTVDCSSAYETYDGSAHTPCTASVSGAGGLSQSLTVSYLNNVNAGTATASASYAGDANHTGSSGSAAFTIAQATASVQETNYSGEYDALPHTASVTITGVGNVVLASNSVTRTNAGNDSTSASTSDPNYNPASGTATVTIAKADVTVTVNPYSVTFDGNSHTATGSVSGVGPVNQSDLNLSGTTHTNAGNYTDTWTFTDTSGNYNNISGQVTDEIGKATATVKISNYSGPYDANPHTASVTITGVGNLVLASNSVTRTNAGNDSTSASTSDPNYNPASGTATVTIAKAAQTITWSNPAPINYGTPLSGAQLNATVVGVQGGSALGALTYSPTAGTVLPVGTQTLTVVAAATGNYNAATASVTLIVLSAQSPITQLIGQVNALVSSGVLNNGNGNALLVKLQAASASFNSGNTVAGINQMGAFINQVNAFVKSGKLTSAQAQPLINAANQIIAAASGGGAALVVDAPTNPATNDTVPASQVGELVSGTIGVYFDTAAGNVTTNELARFEDALAALNATIGTYGMTLVELDAANAANAIVRMNIASTSAAGSAADGVLGCTVPGQITLVTGWNWYTGSNAAGIAPGQYDFQTIVTHELGHAIGLGHSGDTGSVMYAYLGTAETRRGVTAQDLSVIESDVANPHAEPLLASGYGAQQSIDDAPMSSDVHSNVGDSGSLLVTAFGSVSLSSSTDSSTISLGSGGGTLLANANQHQPNRAAILSSVLQELGLPRVDGTKTQTLFSTSRAERKAAESAVDEVFANIDGGLIRLR